MDRINSIALHAYQEHIILKPYVYDFLETLRTEKIPMTIATSSQKSFILPALERNGIAHFFSGIFSCDETGINKNHPDVYLRAAASFPAVPEEIFVAEDSLHALLTAKKAGFKTLAVYDASNESCLKETIREADIYREDLRDPDQIFQIMNTYV